MKQPITGTRGTGPRRRRRLLDVLVNSLLGLILAVLTYKALSVLPSFYEELQVLGIIEDPAVSTTGLNLIIALLVAVLYAVQPIFGSAVALGALVLPVAAINTALVGIYGVLAVLSLPCTAKQGGALLIALVPLAVAYPGLALFLPLVPVLAGVFYGRLLAPYFASFAALLLIVLGLIAGQSAIGSVYVGGDVEPFMKNELFAKLAGVPPVPPGLHEITGAFHAPEVIRRVAAVFLCVQLISTWMGQVVLVYALLGGAWLATRLLAPVLVTQFILWASVGGVVSWLTWTATKRRTPWAIVGTVAAAVMGVVVTVAGYVIIPRAFGAASALPPVSQALASAVASVVVAAVIAVVVAWVRATAQPTEALAAPMPAPASGTVAPISVPGTNVGAEM